MITIVIPTLNEEHYIGVLLECLANQIYQHFEVIIVDAGSTDKTEQVVKTFIAQHRRVPIIFVRSPVKGVSFQRNYGASLSRHQYILFLDADVQLKPEFLTKCFHEYKKRKLDLASCEFAPMSTRVDDQLLYSVACTYLKTLQYIQPVSMGWCIFSSKSAHQAIGGFDESMKFGEDYDYVTRAHKAGFRFKMLRSAKVYISVRRLDDEGRLTYYKKAVLSELYRFFNGKVDKELFEYEFGKFKSDVSAKRYANQEEFWKKLLKGLKLNGK